jgi:ectoine hydroxylase-related dioxygenase (phytanoyl-CoA dioxygenase family)
VIDMSSTAQTQSLDNDYPLSQDQVSSYQRDGHMKLSAVATPDEVAIYRPAISNEVDRLKGETRPLAERDTYGKAFLQITNLWKHDPTVRKFVLARRFGHIAAQLMGVSGVRLYHDQALYKEPGGGGTPWHQDQHYWPLDTNNTITMWMPLVDADTAMGTMRFASGSQKEGYLGDLPISDRSDELLAELLREKGYPVVESGAMKAGDATFHSGWTLHGAPGNGSTTMRAVMTIIYFADGVRVGPTDNENRQNDLQSWLPGLKTGEIAASELNPLVYAAE